MDQIDKWSDLVPDLAKIPFTVYKNRHFIQKWWIKLKVAIGAGSTEIAILGRPSVGKSVLSSALHGETSDISYKLPDTSTGIETSPIELGKWTEIVRVLPGQTTRERLEGLNETFTKSLDGIIYVVDWGYTNVRDKISQKKYIEDLKLDTVEKLREHNLTEELSDFKDTLAYIRNSVVAYGRPKWLIIAVNKVDLYFEKIDQAQQYYDPEANSKFSDILKPVIEQIGKLNLKCLAVPISAYDRPFEWNNEIIKTDIGGRENSHLLTLNFIKQIVNLNQ